MLAFLISLANSHCIIATEDGVEDLAGVAGDVEGDGFLCPVRGVMSKTT